MRMSHEHWEDLDYITDLPLKAPELRLATIVQADDKLKRVVTWGPKSGFYIWGNSGEQSHDDLPLNWHFVPLVMP